jgi:hypothetical protein
MSFTPFPAQVPPVVINELTEKVTPVSDDELLLSDSEDSNAPKKLKISSISIVKPSLEISAAEIDWSLGDCFYKSLSANETFTFSNVSDCATIIVAITNTSGGSVTVQFPAGILKDSSFSGEISASATSIFTFVSINSVTYLAEAKDLG